jgi:ankyrin repeat protein
MRRRTGATWLPSSGWPVDKAALESRDSAGRTPLHVATFARQHAAVQALLQAGADTRGAGAGPLRRRHHRRRGRRRRQPARAAGRRCQRPLVTSRYDGTALIAAAHLGHDGVVRQLIQAGAPLDHVNNLHWTAVIEAIVLGDGGPRHQATLKALLDAGASTQLSDRSGATPLQLARRGATPRWCSLLRAAGAR